MGNASAALDMKERIVRGLFQQISCLLNAH